MVKRSTPVGLAVFITTGIALLLLAPVAPAMPASGLAFQETDTTPAPSSTVLGETAQPDVLAVETSQPQGAPPVAEAADRGSVMFVENVGQWDADARFQVWGGSAGTIWLAEDAIWIVVGSSTPHPADGRRPAIGSEALADLSADLRPATLYAIKLSFVGANPQPRIETFDPQETVVSYFLGNDPEQWRPDVPVWGGVRYVELYPGVDLELNGDNGQMTPRLAIRPGADQGAVRLRVEGVDAVSVDGDILRLSTAAGEVAWPLLNADGIEVGNAQAEPSGTQAFDVAAPFAPANSHRPAASDTQRFPADNPADLLYGTFLGGNGEDQGWAIAVDGAGSAYLTGYTRSSDFPTTSGAFDPGYNGGSDDVFVAKLNLVGSGLAYATFLGGGGWDYGYAIAVDEAGSAYVTGGTRSSNFPTTPGAFDPNHNGDSDAFVAKLNPAGSGLAYATFLGGSDGERGYALAVNGVGSAYVTGQTSSSNFPTTPGAFDTSYNSGWTDAFVVKLNPAGNGLAYATYLGGWLDDWGLAIAVDGAGSAFVTGNTTSSNFPTTPGAFDPNYNGGYSSDAFVAKLNPAGSGLAYATFLGGSSDDYGRGIAVDGVGSTYVTGYTQSFNFPSTPGAFDPIYSGADAFVANLNPSGSRLAYATFLGGSSIDGGNAIAVDGAGSAYVTGETRSSNFPTTPDAFDTSYNSGTTDAFAAKLNPTGSRLTYATFLGGGDEDIGRGIDVDGTGSAYVTGYTKSSDFPTTPGAFDPSYNGGNSDPFVVKLAMGGSGATATPTSTPTRTPTRTPTPMPPRGYVPLILHRWPRIPDAPVLNAITPPDANPRYTVRWNAVSTATSYVLQRATSASFADATQVYAGTANSTNITSEGIARYYYRVKARNQWGDSPWSNAESVEVRWEQEPNYPVSLANGPLVSGLDYYGYPNDAQDYFTFQVASRGQITVDLSNHTGQGVQVILYHPAGIEVARDYQPPYHLVYTGDPGAYYVQVYTESGNNSNTPYTLRAIFP